MTAIVIKKSVTNPQSKLFIITFNLQITDGVVVINQDFSAEYRTGENVTSKVNEVKEKMQAVIDAYKASKVIFDSAALDTAVTSIQGGLNV